MKYNDDLIVGEVPNGIRERTRENMEKYNMNLSDSFEEAVEVLAEKGTELWKAWYYNDFRKFIPTTYISEYLDFEKYPLEYADK